MNQKNLRGIFANLPYKIAALVLACVFWYLVQGEEILEINRKIMVRIKVADGYLVNGDIIRYKDATLSGSRALLGDFSARPIEATIYIPRNKVGRLRYRVDKEFIADWNPRLKLTVHDAYIEVEVDERYTRSVAVREHLQGIPAAGYIVEKTSVEPKNIEVTGLKSEVLRLQHILTEPLDLDGLQRSQAFEIKLTAQGLPPLTLTPDMVKVSVQVGEEKVNRRFGAIPIELEGQQLRVYLRPSYVSMIIQGTPGVLSFIKRGDLRAFLDVRDLPPGRYEKKLQVKIPSDTVLIETFPEYVIVEIEEPKVAATERPPVRGKRK